MSGARLIALAKTNNDVRPIAIGETLRTPTAKELSVHKRSNHLLGTFHHYNMVLQQKEGVNL